jgi:cytochrome c-type biogenesis protein CcmH/NrfG
MTAVGPRWPYLAALLLCLVAWMVRFAAAQSTAELSLAADPEAKEISQLVSEKRWPALVEAAHQLIRSHPGDAAAFYWLGTAQLQLHNAVDAVRALRSAQKLGLDTPFLHESLSLAYYDPHQFTLFDQQMRGGGGERSDGFPAGLLPRTLPANDQVGCRRCPDIL